MNVAQAQGKLLLFGEHAAVYGSPAVGFSLPWTLRVTRHDGPDWQLPHLGPHEPAVRGLIEQFCRWSADEGLPVPQPGRLDIVTDIPLESGFGSSGALCAGLVNLFYPELSLAQRDKLAWRAEGLFHGTPSGIDTALAFRQGWWALDPSTRPVTATALPDPGLVLVVGAVVRQAQTKALVQGLARRREAGDAVVTRTLEALGGLSRRAIAVLQDCGGEECRQTLPPLIQEARNGLRDLGLETAELTTVLDAGLACPGALAGKLSGAGGGGAFLLVFRDRDSAGRALAVVQASLPATSWSTPPKLV